MPSEQPNAPAPAAAAPAPTAPPDQLVEVKVDGKVYMEPVSKLRESYQIQSAAQRRLEQANAIKQQYQDAVAFHEGLNSHLENGDFEGADAKWRGFLEQRAGRSLRAAAPKQNTSVEASDDEVSPQTARMLADIESMRTKLNTVERNTSTERVNREVSKVLSAYPTYDPNNEAYDPDAHEDATQVLLTVAREFPGRPLDEIAAAKHARHQASITRALTRTRDHREEAARQNTGIPSSQGTPQTAERQRFTRADLTNGRARGALDQAAKQFGSLSRAFFPHK